MYLFPQALYNNVIVTGGNSLLRGFTDRLHRDLQTKIPAVSISACLIYKAINLTIEIIRSSMANHVLKGRISSGLEGTSAIK